MLLITKADIGGAQIHLLTLIRNLKVRYEFILVCGEEEFLTVAARKLSIEVIIVSSLQRQIKLSKDYSTYKKLVELIREKNPEFIHIHSSKAGIIGRLAAWKSGRKAIFTAHGWAFTEGAGLLQRSYGLGAEWLIGRLNFDVILVSKYDFALARRFRVITNQSGYLIQNGVESRPFERIPRQTKTPAIVTVGRLVPQKNQELLIRAIANIQSEFKLIIVGDGPNFKELTALAETLSVDHRIEFVRQSVEIAKWFEQADIFALSSIYEGLPLSIIEAMSYSLPVVATDVGGVSELIDHGETGFLVSRNNDLLLAKYLEILINDSNLRSEFGTLAKQKYGQSFTAEKMCKLTESVYQKNISDSV